MITEILSSFTKLVKNNFHQFFKYAVIGVLGLLVDIGIYYLLSEVLSIHYLLANIVSSSTAVVHNYILNSHFTFKVKDRPLQRFLSFYGIALAGMAVSTALLYIMVDVFSLNSLFSKAITIFAVAIIQFFLNKKHTFKELPSNS